MDRVMQALVLIALLLYIAPAAAGSGLGDRSRRWMRRGAVACLAVGLAIALVETAMWFSR